MFFGPYREELAQSSSSSNANMEGPLSVVDMLKSIQMDMTKHLTTINSKLDSFGNRLSQLEASHKQTLKNDLGGNLCNKRQRHTPTAMQVQYFETLFAPS